MAYDDDDLGKLLRIQEYLTSAHFPPTLNTLTCNFLAVEERETLAAFQQLDLLTLGKVLSSFPFTLIMHTPHSGAEPSVVGKVIVITSRHHQWIVMCV